MEVPQSSHFIELTLHPNHILWCKCKLTDFVILASTRCFMIQNKIHKSRILKRDDKIYTCKIIIEVLFASRLSFCINISRRDNLLLVFQRYCEIYLCCENSSFVYSEIGNIYHERRWYFLVLTNPSAVLFGLVWKTRLSWPHINA